MNYENIEVSLTVEEFATLIQNCTDKGFHFVEGHSRFLSLAHYSNFLYSCDDKFKYYPYEGKIDLNGDIFMIDSITYALNECGESRIRLIGRSGDNIPTQFTFTIYKPIAAKSMVRAIGKKFNA